MRFYPTKRSQHAATCQQNTFSVLHFNTTQLGLVAFYMQKRTNCKTSLNLPFLFTWSVHMIL